MNTSLINDFKSKLKNNFTLGCFSKTTDSSIIESIGKAGWDFVILDMEHGPVTTETLKHHVLASYNAGLAPIVRVESFESENIGKALDLGAAGLQIPSVTSAHHVNEVLKRSKFYPEGERGVCRFVKAADYGLLPKNEYFKAANESLIIIQVEGKEGLDNIDEILETGGFDVLFIGPYDLSQSLGYPGEIEHPEVVNEIEKICKKAINKSVYVGTFCDSIKQVKHWKDLGLKYLSYSVDISIFAQSLIKIKSDIEF